jgi:hypothetical protein
MPIPRSPGGGGPGPKRKRPKPKPYSPPASSRPDAAQTPSTTRRPSRPYSPPASSRPDAATRGVQGGGSRSDAAQQYQLPKAERIKRGTAKGATNRQATRKYQRAIAEVYLAATPALKRRIRANAKGTELQIVKAVERYFAERGVQGDRPYTDAERAANARFTDSPRYKATLAEVKEVRELRDKGVPQWALETDPKKLEAMGFAPEGLADKLVKLPITMPVLGGKAAAATAVATAKDPVSVPLKTASQTGDMILALPGAVAEAVQHPVKTAKETVAGIEGRGGESFDEKVERIRDEGALADIADAAVFLPATSAAAKPALAAAVRAGVPGAPSRMPRRAGRVVSGDRIVVPREGGVLRLGSGELSDRVRAAMQERAVGKAERGEGSGVDPLVRRAVDLNREAGEVVAVAPGRLRRAAAQRKAVSKTRAQGVFGLKRELRIVTERARKAVAKLDPREKRAFYYGAQFGIRTPDQGVEELTKLRSSIVAAREAAGWEPKGLERKADMLPEIDTILDAPEKHFTPRLASTLEELTPDSLRVAREDPRLTPRQVDLRREAPLAALYGLERGVNPERRGANRMQVREADVAEFEAAYAKAAQGPRADYLTDYTPEERADMKLLLNEDGTAGAAVKPDGDIVNVFRLPEGPKGAGKAMVREAIKAGGFKLDATGSKLRDIYASLGFKVYKTEQWDSEYGDPPDPKDSDIYYMQLPGRRDNPQLERLGETGAPGQALAQAVANIGDPDFDPGPLPELRFNADETPDQFLARAKAAREARGLAEPLYFRSERYADDPGYADFAAGGDNRMREDQPYRGENLKLGLQDTGIDVYMRGLARNIKAKHNARLIDNLLLEHVIAKYNRHGGASMRELRDELARDGVDMESVAFWNPGIYQTTLRQLDDDIPEELVDLGDSPAQLEALRAATSPSAAEQPGWKIVPRAAMRELEQELQPSMVPGRAYDVAKGWSSRMILLTGNVPWLGAQVVQNMLGGAAATGGKALLPHNWHGAYKRWRALDDDEKTIVGGHLGLDATAADAALRRMGGAGGPITKSWRTLHDWGGWKTGVAKGRGPSISDFNPIQAMARLDRAQNNAARIVVWHTLQKKAEVKALEQSASGLYKLQTKVMATLGKRDGARELANPTNRKLLEQHADATIKFLGDFASLTAFERKFLGRAVMFYPFARFSARLAFYTLPVEHPLVAGLLAQIGSIEAEQREEMFGEGSLRWTGGKVYLPGDKSIDLTKLNPLGNAAFAALGENRPSALLGITPPFVGLLYNQASDEDYFSGSKQFYQGDPSKAYAQGVADLPLVSGTRARLAASDVLSLSAAYRALRDNEINPAQGFRKDPELEGYQGADSLIFAPAPVEFGGEDPDDVEKMKAAAARRNEAVRESNDSWLASFIPFLPENERDAEAAAERLKIQKREDKPAKKRQSKLNLGGSSDNGFNFGG